LLTTQLQAQDTIRKIQIQEVIGNLPIQDSSTKNGLYFSFNTGYNFNASSATDTNNSIIYNNSINGFNVISQKSEAINVSFGKGFNLGGAIGFMFNKNVGAELGINYLFGSQITTTSKSNDSSSEYNDYTRMLQFRPTIIISAGMDKLNPYAKFGFLVGTGSIESESTQKSGSNNAIIKATRDGGIAFGYHAGVGLSYKISEKIDLFGELTMVNMSYAPTKSKVTSATFNGVNRLSELPVIEKETEYVDSIDIVNVDANSNAPRKRLRFRVPFGSFGFNFGLKINL
jgi:opacity protein-like surface antigen